MKYQTEPTLKQIKHLADTIRLDDLCKLLSNTQLIELHNHHGWPIPLDKKEQACNDIIKLIKTQNNKLKVLEEKIRTRPARYLKRFWIILAITATFMYVGILALDMKTTIIKVATIVTLYNTTCMGIGYLIGLTLRARQQK